MTIVLEDQAGQELARIASVPESGVLLQRDPVFPLLSLLDDVSYTVYGRADLAELLRELAMISSHARDTTTRSYLASVIEIVQQCADTPGTTLAFTPFE